METQQSHILELSEALQPFLEELYERFLPHRDGSLSSTLPEFAVSDADKFGLCAITVDGAIYSVGDWDTPFTIQSISKPFVFGMALEKIADNTNNFMASQLGYEPTGAAYDSVLLHEDIQRGLWNPMVNAGALATTSLIPGSAFDDKHARLQRTFETYTTKSPRIDGDMYRFKRKNDHQNRAHAYWMLSAGVMDSPIEEVLDLYFRQCSLLADCRDLAAMAATWANAGTNPLTGKQAISEKHIKRLLSVMYMCGMYDFSGQWAYRVGLPAKSGLTGCILMVVPNVMGIAVYSPRLDNNAKSARGVLVCEDISRHFQLHPFNNTKIDFSHTQEKGKVVFQLKPYIDKLEELIEKPSPSKSTKKTSANAFQTILERVHKENRGIHAGRCYQSESSLHFIDPKTFGICAATTSGEFFEVGDTDVSFLIQSISKVFVYGLALEDYGRNYVHTKVDAEPTGKTYDSVIQLQPKSKRPHNPMVNTGALAITGLIQGHTPAMRLTRILDMYKRYGGREFFIDMPTYISEQNGGDRNWAITYLLREFEMIDGDITQTLDLYLQQCSILLDCRDLALMAATLANGGINPRTGEQAIKPQYVRDILSVMFMCGMYDSAGKWAYEVGFPAKSGVSGALMLVVPGELGIAIYSPTLDEHGNSVRGVKTGMDLFRALNVHIFDTQPLAP